jgi:hypothetical protein
MTKSKALIVAAAGATAALAVGVVALRAREASGELQRVSPPRSTFTLTQARSFAAYPLYDAGPTAAALPLVAVLRRNDGPTDYVSFVYGDCRPAGGAGCAPPVEVQVWAACKRNLSLYGGPGTPTPERVVVRGAPAAFFEDGRRLEIQTGRSTVVVFARSRDEALAVAGSLRAVNGDVRAGERFPGPAPGAVSGALVCAS